MNYPLLFTFRGAIIGQGFLAEVSMLGRLLASLDAEGCWLYGVIPGGVAVDGRDLEDAHRELREALREVLVDLAVGAASFATFRSRVEAFFTETNETTLAEWEDAVLQVRAQRLSFEDLPKKSAASSLIVEVREMEFSDLQPVDNMVASDKALATAA